MKTKNKIILACCLSLIPLSISAPLILTSCTTKSEDPLAKTYQHEYDKDISLFLDKDKNEIVRKPNGKGGYFTQSYLSFRDPDDKSDTYNAWYLLMRDKKTNEIFASFCGWDYGLLTKQSKIPEIIKKGYTVPLSVKLPNNYSVEGLEYNERIPVKALGYGDIMMSELLIGDMSRINGVFPDGDIIGASSSPFVPPAIAACERLDLKDTNIKYIFKKAMHVSYFGQSINTIIFPKELIYLGYDAVTTTTADKNLILDLSYTKLIEITSQGFVNENLTKFILPSTCIRITYIECKNLEINLENVLYYENFRRNEFNNDEIIYLRSLSVRDTINGKDNEITINKNAKYFPESFPEGFEVKFFE